MASLSRSYLFAPGDNERLLAKVFDAGADAVVLDLEDAVAPERKPPARRLVAELLRSARKSPAVYVRINAISTDLWIEDIAAVVSPALTGVRLAKAESAEEIRALDAALGEAERAAGIAIGTLKITATIESAAAVMAAMEIARAPRVEALAFGAADFIRDIGASPDEAETQTLYARSHLVVASRAAGINPPIASVYTRIKDLDGLRATTEAARRLGFFGRSCIHPSQVPIVNQIFTPTAEQVAEARAIIAAFERARSAGVAAVAMENGQFVDQAVVKRARAIIALSEPQ
jgi:citrate lyase subunit beta/citryl-CoA lyase